MSIFSKMHAKHSYLDQLINLALSGCRCSYGRSFWGMKLPLLIFATWYASVDWTWSQHFEVTLWKVKNPNWSKVHPWPIYACCLKASSPKLICVQRCNKKKLSIVKNSNNQKMTLLFIRNKFFSWSPV